MKIKKKDYEKEISDAYWRGFDAGVKIAKEKPELVDKLTVAQIRAFTNKFKRRLRIWETVSRRLLIAGRYSVQ